MTSAFEQRLRSYQQRAESCLERELERIATCEATLEVAPLSAGLHQAMAYSALQGGKRIRPALVYAAAATIGKAPDDDLDLVAVAVECLHCYSLVHDDLPAMDNDELRRGQPTCHIKFDEATAILVGDALQTLAFELLVRTRQLAPARQVALVRELAAASGLQGMVGGQFIDLKSENRAITLPQLETMHQLKTGAIIRAALRMGAICAGANESQLAALDDFGTNIGLAFQVKDDLLDVESSTETLGKPQGSDQHRNKSTYPALLGLEQTRAYCDRLHRNALLALNPLQDRDKPLAELAAFIIERNH